MPKKPDVLVAYERCQELNLPMTSGGVMNQPHIWLQEIAVAIDEKSRFEFLEKLAQEQERMASGK